MEDSRIIELYCSRSEDAIAQTSEKYGSYCRTVAFNVLNSREDAEECVNDTYIRVWNSIPPQKPANLRGFIGKITRNLALDRYRSSTSVKRGGDRFTASLEELSQCLGDSESVCDAVALKDILERFIRSLSKEQAKVFLQRYWYFCSVSEIADDVGISESKVKVMLFRIRGRLKDFLAEEGFEV